MSANSKFGRFITSAQFSARVGDLTEKAVADLRARGFEPVIDSSKDKPASATLRRSLGVVRRKTAHN